MHSVDTQTYKVQQIWAYPDVFTGLYAFANDKDTSYEQYINAITPKDIVPNQVNYYRNTSKFFVSMMKTFYGDKATKENGWGF